MNQAVFNFMILIVDDEPVSLRVIANFLEQASYSFTLADSGNQAWHLLEKSPDAFSLVIADRVMPGLDGIQLLEKMRQNENLKDLPLILLTGQAEKTEVIQATKAGAADFLYKPVEKVLLLAVVKRMLKL